MVDLDLLAQRARRVSEIGRLRVAARMAPATVVYAVAGAFIAGSVTPRILLASALLTTLVVFFRWRSRAAGNGASAGLIAAAAPIAMVFVVRAMCGPDSLRECGTYCSAIGFATAAIVTATFARTLRSYSGYLAAAATAVAAIAVGCAGLGFGVAAAVGMVLLAGVLAGWGASRALASA